MGSMNPFTRSHSLENQSTIGSQFWMISPSGWKFRNAEVRKPRKAAAPALIPSHTPRKKPEIGSQ
ncbi:hypothetical protein D3C72_2508210 [compost metagenome]